MLTASHPVEDVHPAGRGIARRSLRRGALIAALLALGAGAAEPARALQAVDYLPLVPGTSWTRSSPFGTFTETVLPGTVMVNGVATRVVELSQGGVAITRFHYTVDASGARVHRISFPTTGESWTYDPPYGILPGGNFSVGTEFSETSAITVAGATQPAPHQRTNELTVSRIESVTVPAGTFTALVVENEGSQFGSPVTSTVWFAEGVGIVKTSTNTGSFTIVEELTALPEPAGAAGAALAALVALAARQRPRPVR